MKTIIFPQTNATAVFLKKHYIKILVKRFSIDFPTLFIYGAGIEHRGIGNDRFITFKDSTFYFPLNAGSEISQLMQLLLNFVGSANEINYQQLLLDFKTMHVVSHIQGKNVYKIEIS